MGTQSASGARSGVASPIPHSFPLSRAERGRVEPPFSSWEKGGDEGTGVPAQPSARHASEWAKLKEKAHLLEK